MQTQTSYAVWITNRHQWVKALGPKVSAHFTLAPLFKFFIHRPLQLGKLPQSNMCVYLLTSKLAKCDDKCRGGRK